MKRPLSIIIIAALTVASCTGNRRQSAQTVYETAVSHYRDGNHAEALIAAIDASEADPADSTLAGIHALIYECHRITGNHTMALESARLAAGMSPDDPTARHSLVEAMISAEKPDEALEILAGEPDRRFRLEQTAQAAMAAGRHDLAKNALSSMLADSAYMDIAAQATLATLLTEEGKHDSAATVLADVNAALSSDPDALKALAAYYSAAGIRDRAIDAYRQLAAVQDSMMDNMVSQGVYEKLYRHERSRLENEQRRARKRAFMMAGGITVTTLLVITLLTLILYRRTAESRRALQTQTDMLLLHEEMRQIKESSDRSRLAMRNLMKDRYEKVEMAANLLLDNSFSKNSDANITSALHDEVSRCRQPQFLSALEDALNRYCDNVIARLRTSVPSLSPQEMTLALYCAAGLSARVISMLTDRSAASLYTARHRLRKKIQKSGIPQETIDEFLSLIH